MMANKANVKGYKTYKPGAKVARQANGANRKPVLRDATPKEIEQVRAWLGWFVNDGGFTYTQLERTLSRSGGWCNKVLRDVDRYHVTLADYEVIRASYRAAYHLRGVKDYRYEKLSSLVKHLSAALDDAGELAET